MGVTTLGEGPLTCRGTGHLLLWKMVSQYGLISSSGSSVEAGEQTGILWNGSNRKWVAVQKGQIGSGRQVRAVKQEVGGK